MKPPKPAKSTTELRIRLASATVAELVRCAKANRRDRDDLIADALRLYFDVEGMVLSNQNLQAAITSEREEIRGWLRTIADFIVDAERASLREKQRPPT